MACRGRGGSPGAGAPTNARASSLAGARYTCPPRSDAWLLRRSSSSARRAWTLASMVTTFCRWSFLRIFSGAYSGTTLTPLRPRARRTLSRKSSRDVAGMVLCHPPIHTKESGGYAHAFAITLGRTKSHHSSAPWPIAYARSGGSGPGSPGCGSRARMAAAGCGARGPARRGCVEGRGPGPCAVAAARANTPVGCR